MILDNAILQGQPHFPHDMVEVSGVIKEHHVRFVYIAPWVSSCPAGSGCRTLKPPGEPPIRCCLWPEHYIARCSQSHVRTEAKVIYARESDCQC